MDAHLLAGVTAIVALIAVSAYREALKAKRLRYARISTSRRAPYRDIRDTDNRR
jgi:hypothetical protein